MNRPSANVAGLPMSWRRAAIRTTGRSARAASTVRTVWSQRSSPGTLFWGMPRWAASSGEIQPRQTGRLERSQPERRHRRGKEPVELGGDPLAREVLDELRPTAHRGEGRRLDRELQGRGEARRPDHPQGILAEPRVRIADRPEDPQGEVRPTVVRIHERRADRRVARPRPSR